MLVELVDWDENYTFAHYDRFRIGSEDEGYVVTVSGYNGTAGDSLSFTDKTKFSTRNFDLDKNPAMSCAEFCCKYITLIATRFIDNLKKHCSWKLVVWQV